MQAVEIRWTETSQHKVVVAVPDDFDIDLHEDYDLANGLAALDDDGFIGLTRQIESISAATVSDDLEQFAPTRS